MKKIMFYICLLFMPFFVFAEDTCNQDDIKIESIVLDSTSGNIEETSNPNTDNNQVNLGLKMNVIDDSITYKIVITNTSNQDYTFDKNSLSTDYLNYAITYEDNSDIVKAGESKVIYLTVNYSSKPSIDKLSNGVLVDNPKVTFNLQKEEAQNVIEEVAKAIVNPDTKDVIGIFLLILIISLVITIILFKKSKRVKYTIMLIVFILLTSNVVKALCTCTLDINTSLEIDAKEAVFLPGNEVNVKMKELAGDDTSTVNDEYLFKDVNITTIKYSELEPSDNNKREENIVSTIESKYPIYMWFDNGTIYWWSEDETPSLNEDASDMFFRLSNLNNIEGLGFIDASKTKNINYLLSTSSIENISILKNWNTSSVEKMIGTFYDDKKLLNLHGLEKWDTSNVTDMSYIFSHDFNLNDVSAIKTWNVTKVTDMSFMFACNYTLEEIDLSYWETKSLTKMKYMFASLEQADDYSLISPLKKIYFSKSFDTSKVTDMSGLFYNIRYLEDYNFLRDWDVSSVENMQQLFQRNRKITTFEYIKDWDVSNVTNMYLFCAGCLGLTNLNYLDNWDVSKVTTMERMFYGSTNIIDASALNNWNIINVSNFQHMFYNVSVKPEFTKVNGVWQSNGTFIPNS